MCQDMYWPIHVYIYILTLSDSTWVCTYTLALQLTYNLFIDALTYIAKCGTHIDIVYLHNIRIFIYIHVYKFIYCILYLHMHLYRHLRAIWYVLSFVYRVYIIIYIIIYIQRERDRVLQVLSLPKSHDWYEYAWTPMASHGGSFETGRDSIDSAAGPN